MPLESNEVAKLLVSLFPFPVAFLPCKTFLEVLAAAADSLLPSPLATFIGKLLLPLLGTDNPPSLPVLGLSEAKKSSVPTFPRLDGV